MTFTDEMLSGLSPENRQRLEWRMRSSAWLIDHISGTPEDKEQFLAMWDAALDRSFYEGTVEAKRLVEKLAEGIHHSLSLDFVAGKIGELAEMNKVHISELAL